MSSYGHIRDLSKKNFSVTDGDFTPEYEIPEDKKNLVRDLKKAAAEAETVWLASDEDREGEAIAWHLYQVLGLKDKKTKRIVFHEITKDAILHAIENPRDIDINLVDAQQARRVLDRIVGFELSPVLWKKIKPALSAGRVQSVAVRLIVERENEIKEFVPTQYFRVLAAFTTPGGTEVRATLNERLPDEESARKFLEDCKDAKFTVDDIEIKPLKKSPAPPFTTSTLQQEASRKLGFTVSQTMMVAQRLYEAGHITYMRTDSLNLSTLALNSIAKEIKETMGDNFYRRRQYHTSSKGAQEAHEAIRPTYINRHTVEGNTQEKKLYNLIWKRTIASQMADAELEKTTVTINPSTRPEQFNAFGEVVKFEGFLKVYLEGTDETTDSEAADILPELKVGEKMTPGDIVAQERFTQHPPRYTEANLVKKMEDLGIGRPATYATTISTIQQRGYIERGDRPGVKRKFVTLTLKDHKVTSSTKTEITGADKGKFIPTDTGTIVNDFLTEYFSNVLDYNFTANVEERLDMIADGKANWNQEIGEFYDVFHPEVTRANDMRFEHKVGERVLGTDPASGRPVSVKIGRFGPVVQIGGSTDAEKPQFASLRKDQSVFDITLEEALKLFELPRNLGEFEGKEITVAVGRFGPYIRHDNKFVSIPKDFSPLEITAEEAQALILAKREADSKKTVKVFDEDPDMMILNGRYGLYIYYKKANYKIPKSVPDPAALTYEECKQIVESQPEPAKKTRRAAPKKK